MLESTIVTFSKLYKGLNNIYKFSKEDIVKDVSEYFDI